ncbi:ATP-binding protein [Desulfosporosinus sp. SYSU MS00001]|uniref:ATP-binding protein n=1 Tax=Desulfosporosinus sp. SYSU MS00001 TaxID=3416284 RepID=UPI003CE96274
MNETVKSQEELIQENIELRHRLDEANSIINAIRNGEVDAFLLPGDNGGKVYVLEGADHIYRLLVEEMQEGCLTVAQDGTILFSNENFAEIVKTPQQYLAGQSFFEFLSSSDREYLHGILDLNQDHFKTELSLITQNGLNVPVLISASLCQIDNESFICLLVTDLTELKRSNRLNTLAFEQANSPQIVSDQIGRVIKVNQAAKEIFGNKIIGEIFDRVIPLYKETTGSRFLIQKELKKGPVSCQEVVFNKNIYFMVNAGYIYGEQPNNLGCLITLVDITENRRYKQELSRLDRLNLVGEMAAGIGHEVRNPMTVVRGYLQMFSSKELFASHKESINIMIEEIDRANSIITEFLSLAKTKKIPKKEIDLNEVIGKIIPLVEVDALRQGHEIKLELQEVPNILGDEKELRQCILNLVRNGLEAMSNKGTITIKTYLFDGQVVLEVQDQGCGIPVEVQKSIGTPFLTTKDKGTGLGLPVCFSIAERHGAVLDYKTDSGGTSFYFKCPGVSQQLTLPLDTSLPIPS